MRWQGFTAGPTADLAGAAEFLASSHSTCLVLVLQSGVDLTNVKMSMNPFCEIAVEVGGAAQRGGRLTCMA